jgi:hypothetical protein
MKHIKLLFVALTFSCLLLSHAFAGEMPTGGVVPPICPPGETCVVSGGDASGSATLADSSTSQSTFVADPIVGSLLALLGLY